MNISFYIAWRYWRAKRGERFGRLVASLASLGIMLGVTALIVVLSIMNGLEQQQKQQVLSTIPQAIISNEQGYFDNQSDLSILRSRLPSFVTKLIPINSTNVILQSQHGVSSANAIGIQHFSDDNLLAMLPSQAFEQLLPAGQFNLIIGSRLADQLKLNVGDKVRLILSENSQYTPFGRMPTQRLFTISQIYYASSEASAYQIFANLADMGRLLRLSADQFQGYRLFLDDPFKITELARHLPLQWQLEDWRSQKGEFFQAVRMEKNMMGLLISLIIIVAVSNIVTSLSLMVMDKQGEIAILQTQGLNKKQIRHIFIFQGLFVGTVGTLIGCCLGLGASFYLPQILQWFNPNMLHLPILIDYPQILWIILFSLWLALLSTLYPAYRAAKIDPAEALRYE